MDRQVSVWSSPSTVWRYTQSEINRLYSNYIIFKKPHHHFPKQLYLLIFLPKGSNFSVSWSVLLFCHFCNSHLTGMREHPTVILICISLIIRAFSQCSLVSYMSYLENSYSSPLVLFLFSPWHWRLNRVDTVKANALSWPVFSWVVYCWVSAVSESYKCLQIKKEN